jgi:hypothetical protein
LSEYAQQLKEQNSRPSFCRRFPHRLLRACQGFVKLTGFDTFFGAHVCPPTGYIFNMD